MKFKFLALWLAASILMTGLSGADEGSSPKAGSTPKAEAPLTGKKVLMVIAPKNFRDEELALPKKLLEKKGAEITIASTTLDEAEGMLGAKVTPTALIKDVKTESFDAIVFIGGNGARVLFEDRDAHRLARNAKAQGKVLGAICLAPVILANAGVLKDQKATVYPTDETKRLLKEGGAITLKKAVVEDGLLITANGPNTAARFGDAIIRALALPFKNDPAP